jgi:molecular chaperone DnaK
MTFIGVDLGTTNSAICSYDGENVRLYKSPEQHDVTPSAIFIDKRGNKYVGSRASLSAEVFAVGSAGTASTKPSRRRDNNAARNPDNAATLFKRLMGTSTPVRLPAVNLRRPRSNARLKFSAYSSDICQKKFAQTKALVPS